ncbi:MAG: antibiotic biosynthesis monooxygenase [Microbacteriaceae bacterium]
MIRVVHQVPGPVQLDLHLYTEGLPGDVDCRTFGDAAAGVTVLERWPTEAAFAEFWNRNYRSTERLVDVASVAATEIYRYEPFTRIGWTWMPSRQRASARLHWGNAGPVRVLYQFTVPEGEQAHDPHATRETLREPGCLEFAYLSEVTASGRYVLLELWASQYEYDVHWRLRQDSGEASPARAPLDEPEVASEAEFYRHRRMHCHYGLWSPVEPGFASNSIDWPVP